MNLQNRIIYCSDNLNILKGIDSNSIDLIYLDPPFSKNKTFIANQKIDKIDNIKKFFEHEQTLGRFKNIDFNEIFRDVSFDDSWSEKDLTNYYQSEIDNFNSSLIDYLQSVQKSTIRGGFYYLIYMSIRLIEMKRILKDTGSIYLHCDPTISHYLKNVMDKIFGYDNFRNEISWCYDRWDVKAKKFQNMHDTIFFYSKNENYFFNVLYEIDERRKKTIERGYTTNLLKNNKRQLIIYEGNENKENIQKLTKKDKFDKIIYKKETELSRPVKDYWSINFIHPKSKERIGYPTQKPLALLERIIKASSNKGDIVLDPFCGCATTCVASEHLDRRWVGIDINQQAFYLNYYRIRNSKEYLGETKWSNVYQKLIYINKKENFPKRNDLTEADKKEQQQKLLFKTEFKKQPKIKLSKLTFDEKKIAKELLYDEQKGFCNGCGSYLKSVDLTIDHIKPQAKGGTDDLDNLQLLCYRCNNWKRTGTMKDLFEKLLKDDIITKDLYDGKIKNLSK